MFRRCVMGKEISTILFSYYNSIGKEHFLRTVICQNILKTKYYWARLFQDAYRYTKTCDAC